MPKTVHLICNAHLDPVWLWPWEDGLAETLSTFRVAADFCDEHPAFVFNHNEALLYRWVETHDPALFSRIKRLVARGKWHIAGGSYVQPDINTPSGESHIRQFLHGVRYFRKMFDVRPTTAYNFDPFGQPEGYAQILAGCGFDSYVFCRPDFGTVDLPVGAFTWRDRSGSSVIARRGDDHYLTNGAIRAKLDRWLEHYRNEPEVMLLWGVGNHGGGASRAEYAELNAWATEHPEYSLRHSTPEAFFASVKNRDSLPVVTGEIQRNFPGCYTSFARLKRLHRKAEHLAQSVERLCALAWWSRLNDHPREELNEAWRDILFCEFHDILPGSSVPSSERDSLDCLARATEILRRIRMRTLIACTQSMPRPQNGAVPIVVSNPHGFPVRTTVECEYALCSIGFQRDTAEISICDQSGTPVVFQREKEEANLPLDWRVKVAMDLELAPFELKRLDATYVKRSEAQPWTTPPLPAEGILRLTSDSLDVTINTRTGLLDALRRPNDAQSVCVPGALCPVVFADTDNCWTCGDPTLGDGTNTSMWLTMGDPWKEPIGRFRLATPVEAFALASPPQRRIAGGSREMAPVHVIEDGAVRMIVEAILVWRGSAIVRHYVVGKRAGSLEIRDRVLWNEKDCILKVEVPASGAIAGVHAETPYSAVYRAVPEKHLDQPNQRWIAMVQSESAQPVLTIVNDGSFAHSMTSSALYLNVLRSPAYSCGSLSANHPLHSDRFLPRQDQGEHEVRFGFALSERLDEATAVRAASEFNAPAFAYPFYPGGTSAGGKAGAVFPPLSVSPHTVLITTVKRAEDSDGLIVRLQEMSGAQTEFSLALGKKRHHGSIAGFGLHTLKITRSEVFSACNLIEEPTR